MPQELYLYKRYNNAMIHEKAKDQSMRIPPEGRIRNANVLSLLMSLYVPSKTAKTIISNIHVLIFRKGLPTVHCSRPSISKFDN